MAKAITGLTISVGLNPMLDVAVRTLGGDYPAARKMAGKLTTRASTLEIERAVRTLQVMKGKTYAKALEKENGRVPGGIVDLGITQMLYAMRITLAELDGWYSTAERTKFQHTLFSPLPEKADARLILDDLRLKMFSKHAAARELLRLEEESKALPEHTRLSAASLRAAIGVGMWPLFFEEHKQEAFLLLQWPELPLAGRLDYFNSLAIEEQERIWQEQTAEAREKATRALFERQYKNPVKMDELEASKKGSDHEGGAV